jgi:hypothetical protein
MSVGVIDDRSPIGSPKRFQKMVSKPPAMPDRPLTKGPLTPEIVFVLSFEAAEDGIVSSRRQNRLPYAQVGQELHESLHGVDVVTFSGERPFSAGDEAHSSTLIRSLRSVPCFLISSPRA